MKTKTITVSKKVLALGLAGVLLIGGSIGGTLAWLVDTTSTVTNTFTYGDINITLEETTTGTETVDDLTGVYEILPGMSIEKDPTIIVEAGSEKCWLFVQVEESSDWPSMQKDAGGDKIAYSMAFGWIQVKGTTNVYYQVVDADSVTEDLSFFVLENNEITVSETLTKDEVDVVVSNYPTLSITAYAVQYDAVDYDTNETPGTALANTAQAAWAVANPSD